jgi:tetratricopeptide (TPR) repeat protein
LKITGSIHIRFIILRRFIFFLSFLSCNAAILFSQNPSVIERVKYFDQGTELYHRNDYNRAIIKFKCFLDLSPPRDLRTDSLISPPYGSDNENEHILTAYFKVAVCFIMMKEYDSGIAYLDKGLLLFKQTRFQNEKLVTDFLFQKANCCFFLEEYNNASHLYHEAMSHMPAGDPLIASAYMNLGDICFITEDIDNAIDHYKKA